MIAITTSSSISVNPDERFDSLRIVCIDSLLENSHLFERARYLMGKMFRVEKRGELTPAGGIGSNLPWVGMSSLPPSVTGGKLLRRRNYRSVGMSFSER